MTGDFLDSLKSEGALATRGQFQLDQGKAREKMEKFQLVNPYLYVLELIQGAQLLGASQIDVFVDADEMRMTFDGDGLSAEEMTDIYSAAFSRDPDDRIQAKRHFAIALTAIGAINAAEVRMVMKARDGAAQFIRRKDEESIEPVALDQDSNEFYVKEKFRFGHLFEFLDASGTALEEAKILQRRCTFSRIPIYVNGKNVSRGHYLPDDIDHVVEIDWDGDRGLLGIKDRPLHAPDRRSKLNLVQNGVLITDIRLSGHHVAVEGVIETSRLTKNLSQSAFVADEVFEHLINEVIDSAVLESMCDWVQQVQVSTSNYTVLREIAVAKFKEMVVEKPKPESPLHRLATTLERLPIWPVATDLSDREGLFRFGSAMMSSLRRLAEGPPTEPIPYANRRFHTVQRDSPVFLLSGESESVFEVFKRYKRKEWVDVTEALVDSEHAQKNRLRWQNRPWSEPAAAFYDVHITFEFRGLQIAIYNVRDRRDGVALIHVHDGNVLNSGNIPEQLPGAKVVIRGQLEVDDRWEAPMRTPRLKEAYMEVVKRLPQLWLKVAADPRIVSSDVIRTQLGIATVQLVSGSYFNFALAGFGFDRKNVANDVYDLVNDESLPEVYRLASSSYLSRFESRGERIRARVEALGALAQIPIIPCSDGHHSLADLHRFIGDDGKAWTGKLGDIRQRIGTRRWPRGPIVDESYPWGYIMRSTFEEVSDAGAVIEVEVARQRFEQRPPFQVEQVLNVARHLRIGSTSGERWTAQWGIRKVSVTPDCWVFPLFRGRLVEKLPSDKLFGTLDIVVEGPIVELNAAGDGLDSREWIEKMQQAVDVSARTEVTNLARRLAAGESVDQREMGLVWWLMSEAARRSDPLGDVPFVRDADGDEYSALQLRKMAHDRRLHWAHAGHAILEDAVPAGEPVIVLPAMSLTGHLEQIVGDAQKMVDCSATEERQRQIERSRGRFYARAQRRRDVPFSVAKTTVTNDGMTTIAGLVSGDSDSDVNLSRIIDYRAAGETNPDSTIVVCREWREVENLTFSTIFGHFRVVHDNPRLRLDPNWDHVEQDTSYVVDQAREACGAVLVDYLSRVLRSGTSQSQAIRRRVLGWFARGLVAGDLDGKWADAWELIRSVPIFMKQGGSWVSVNEIGAVADVGKVHWLPRGRAPAQTHDLLLVLEPDESKVVRRAFPGKIWEAQQLDDTGGTSSTVSADGSLADANVETSSEASVAESDEAAFETLVMPAVVDDDSWHDDEPGPRVYDISDEALEVEPTNQTPGAKLVGHVRDLMRRATENSAGFLPNAHIDSVVLWGNDPKRVARVAPENVSVMTDHVATIYALEEIDDPVRRAFLTSAVITALNFHYEEIADTDEIELQRALLEQWSVEEER